MTYGIKRQPLRQQVATTFHYLIDQLQDQFADDESVANRGSFFSLPDSLRVRSILCVLPTVSVERTPAFNTSFILIFNGLYLLSHGVQRFITRMNDVQPRG